MSAPKATKATKATKPTKPTKPHRPRGSVKVLTEAGETQHPRMLDGLTVQQAQAVDYYLTGMTVTEIAKVVRRSRDTVSIWMNSPEVVAEITRLVRERREVHRRQIESATTGAITELARIATQGYEEKDRVAAAKVLLGIAIPSEATIEVTGANRGPIQIESTSRAITLELSRLFAPPPSGGDEAP